MSLAPSRHDVDRFQAAVSQRLGLSFPEHRRADLERLLAARLAATSAGSVEQYLLSLGGREEQRELGVALTVGETYFFRNEPQITALVDAITPVLSMDGAARVLCAGCSSGEEAYSIAIAATERAPVFAHRLAIFGIDLSPVAIASARAARYGRWSLRVTSDERRARWFTADEDGFTVTAQVRRLASFEQRNLIEDDPSPGGAPAFHAVFCRNMLMYLHPAAARAVVARLCRALHPGGYLFLGHAETLRDLSDELELCQEEDAFFYRKPGGLGVPARPAREREGWAASIERSAVRIADLAARTEHPTSPDGSAPDRAPPPEDLLGPAVELAERELFTETIELLRALPAETLASPRAQRLLAFALASGGDLAEAERACRALVEGSPSDSEAHYLLALCHARAGCLDEAAGEHRLAAGLDQAFAMPRLHLGLLERRSGDVAAARIDLGAALELLAADEPSRLRLHGGGFGRAALMGLCRAELRALEESSPPASRTG